MLIETNTPSSELCPQRRKSKALHLKSAPKVGVAKGGKESGKRGENCQIIRRVENGTRSVPLL